ncbi:MAG: hypothetical protein A3F12_06205 [Gammaproteobacteria bacterium RIFCSPHIGHO2_12_FULL_38_14]|nr:MAG: hypothetical protein A3F12_06205 [Gammaproteobacteria bacterium RIFCSPHIGHO2_12_FULL_38_14]
MRLLNRLKKISIFIGILFFSIQSSSHAQEQQSSQSDGYLKLIADNTYSILGKINDIPKLLDTLTKMALSFLSDESDPSSKTSSVPLMQSDFTALGTLFTQNNVVNPTFQQFQQQLTLALLDPDKKFSDANGLLAAQPNINDLVYATLMGLPPDLKASGDTELSTLLNTASFNYIKNATGLTIPHIPPSFGWNPTDIVTKRYVSYYNSVIAAQSFGAYALGQIYQETRNNNQMNTIQTNLLTKATNADWFAGITTKELGKILREILMFESQNYVLMSKLLETEKQILTAQIMTNTIMIANNQLNEAYLLGKAQGTTPNI